jgi:cell division transport system permease protein
MIFFHLLFQGIRDTFRVPLAILTNILSITVLVFLCGCFFLILYNLNLNIKAYHGDIIFQVYWKSDTSKEIIIHQWNTIGEMPGVLSVETFTPSEAAEHLRQRFDIKEQFTEDIFPFTAVLSVRLPDGDAQTWTQEMHHRLQNLPGVERVNYDPVRVDLAASWFAWSQRILYPICGSLLVLVALASAVTVRSTITSKHEEIEILNLIGASPLYIRIPLIVSSVLQGAIAASLAMALLYGALVYFQKYFPHSLINFSFLPQNIMLIIIGIISFCSFIGSTFSFKKI